MTRNVTDPALVLNAIAGYDSRDPGSANVPVPDFTSGINAGVEGTQIGIPINYFTEKLDHETEQAVQTAVQVLESLGAVVVPIEIPQAEYLKAVEWGIMVPEASAYHRRALRESPELFTEEVRGLLEVGETVLATDYIDALRFRQAMKAAPDGSTEAATDGYVRLSIPANLFGLPSLQVPCGFSTGGLPLGMQIMGRPFAEDTILAVGKAYEQATDTVGRLAPL